MVALRCHHFFMPTSISKQERLDQCFSSAKQYQSRIKFFKESHNDYCYLQRHGRLQEACAHMSLDVRHSLKRWTSKEVFEIASRYSRRSDFRRENEGAYAFALANNLLEPVCMNMRGGQFWHVFELMCVARKYGNKQEFMKAERAAYNFANINQLTEIACEHMETNRVNWTRDKVMSAALECKTRSEFFAKIPGAYKHAQEHGYWAEACAHMEVKKRQVDKAFVIAEATKYKTRTEFQILDGGAYAYACKGGFLDEACAHMEAGDTGFNGDKSAILYHLQITTPAGQIIYKLGITNRTPERRIAGMGLLAGVSAIVLNAFVFPNGRDARIAEKRLHRKFAEHRYCGQPVMKNGNTELFMVPVIEC